MQLNIMKMNAANEQGDTPLHLASRWGYGKITWSLIRLVGQWLHLSTVKSVIQLVRQLVSQSVREHRYNIIINQLIAT